VGIVGFAYAAGASKRRNTHGGARTENSDF
jgi:hypothetical protein